MSERGNFLGGFLLGSLVGGATGAVVGVLLTSRSNNNQLDSSSDQPLESNSAEPVTSQSQYLEAKIAQLNDAIDDVRQQLKSVQD